MMCDIHDVGVSAGDNMKMTVNVDRPQPPQTASQEILMTAETPGEYFS